MSFQELFGPLGRGENAAEVSFRPTWSGPPEDVLGRAVPLGVVLARSERGAVGLSHGIAYPNGITLEFVALARGLSRLQANTLFHEQHMVEGDELPAGLLRVGIELPDGRRVSNLGSWHARQEITGDGDPEGPLLLPTSGGSGMTDGGGVVMHPSYWLWPLPERGKLRITCEWPIVEIPLTTTEIDASRLVDAAAKSVDLWQ